MQVHVDLIDEVVFLVDESFAVRDAFRAVGKTVHESEYPASFYTYKSLLTMPGYCCVCGSDLGHIGKPCVSSGGFHAFAGVAKRTDVADQHKAEHRSLELRTLRYEELVFFVESDNLFPISQILMPISV